jgi:hypothetical protein
MKNWKKCNVDLVIFVQLFALFKKLIFLWDIVLPAAKPNNLNNK